MTDDPDREDLIERLAEVLIEKEVISEAQVQLAQADQEVSGMSFDEVLTARGWVDKETLKELAPWLYEKAEQKTILRFAPGKRNYQESFNQYRQLLEQIIGESWD